MAKQPLHSPQVTPPRRHEEREDPVELALAVGVQVGALHQLADDVHVPVLRGDEQRRRPVRPRLVHLK
eukprot:7501085-Pyramimonas_sp.AAC.1